MLNDEAVNAVPAGLPSGGEEDRAAMESLSKYRGSAGFAGKSALTGAAMGIQAGQGAMNPMTAFIQGAAAGLQAPAQIFAQKQAQVKSTLDAMPFGNRFPELGKKYPLLAGMPSALALETMKAIATDTQKVLEESKARKEEKQIEYIQPGADAERAAKLLQETDPQGIKRTPESLVGMRKQDLDNFIKMQQPKGVSNIGSVAADRAFAREYSDYLAGGGYSDTQNQIKSLEDAREQLKSGGQYTGYFTNLFSGKAINPKALALQQQVEQSIQRTLKQTLGGQFTEREGQLFMQRGFDPKLSEVENTKKLTRMIDQLKIMDIAKREAIDYFEQNGTLSGYKGRYFTIKDGQIVSNDLQQPTETGTGLSTEEEKRLQELEKKAASKKK